MALENFPTTTAQPRFPSDETPDCDINQFRAMDGTIETTTEQAAPRKTRKLHYECDETDYDLLKAFYVARFCGLEPFNFTCPRTSESFVAQFDPKGCNFRPLSTLRFEVNLLLYESNE